MAKARRRAAALKKAAEAAANPSVEEVPAKAKGAPLSAKNAATAVAGNAEAHASHIAGIVCTGELESHPLARDVKIGNMSLSYHGSKLIEDTLLELTSGRRYGFIGPNGSGKSTLLKAIAYREGIPLPEHIDVFYLDREAEASNDTALEAVVKDITNTRDALEAQAEKMAEEDPEADVLMDIYERLDELDPAKSERDAAKILHGLGFDQAMQAKATKDFSGGWRMRISLAKALLAQPSLLLLDDPTNHLDLEACVWLEEYLKDYPRCLVMVSHSQDFLNGVCTHIMQLQRGKLIYYSGNYDTYVRTRAELEENQMKRYNWEQAQIADMKNYIARFGHGSAKLARQAQSKEKVLAKMIADGLTEKVYVEKTIHFRFGDVEELPPPVLQAQAVHFGYPGAEKLYSGVEFGLDMDSRVALVGPNGAGKTTLLKLITQELNPTDGMIRAHQNLIIARYHQHLTDQLDPSMSPLAYMLQEYPELTNGDEGMRKVVGRFGLTGKVQTTPIKQLSDGQKARVVFAWLSCRPAHLLCLDEPTNGLDLETIDALADAINAYNGGVVLVSHDFRLINQVAKEIWECRDGDIKIWKGDILAYKKHLRKQMGMAE